jgi:hypothetical protein
MSTHDPDNKDESSESNSGSGNENNSATEPRPKEIGGREGPDPTRYSDWEKGGRCIDF